MTGPFLAAVWVAEASIIVGLSTLSRIAILHHPYCEYCSRWTNIEPIKRDLSLADAGGPLKTLLSGDLTSLMRFSLAQNDNSFVQLELASCPNCTDSQYLTIFQVNQSYDKKGKLKIQRKPLVRNMLIAAEDVPSVKKNPAEIGIKQQQQGKAGKGVPG